ncbi:sensor histidine kinase [Pusillimonas minor]|uniref:histidine kinase n=1 Tax=Pusillimonas minor TaxID=2697024 RepID=A0A842HUG6_9BURK|nr:sensor histidine kinase [Pusillimonas minor]MBC2770445.1 sensor histidine kinase [Pusillimonas minor]
MAQLVLLVAALGIWPSAKAQVHLGPDLPFVWHEDQTAAIDLDEFLKLPDTSLRRSQVPVSLGYTASALWVKIFLPASAFEGKDGWLTVGPNFINDIVVYFRPAGSDGDWARKDAGDLWPGKRGDIDYRFAVFNIPAPVPGNPGYDVVFRAESDSALLLKATLRTPADMAEHAAKSTGFWSFYFGLAAISFGLALLMAIFIRKPFLWSICLFSLTYVLVACVEGFVNWLIGDYAPNLQHYLTSVLNLMAFSSLLWMWSEMLEFKRHAPKIYRFVLGVAVLIALLTLLIPLGRYGLAVKIQTLIFSVGVVTFLVWLLVIYLQKKISLGLLLLGMSPLVYFATGIMAQLSLYGLIPYYDTIYVVWQYALMLNILTVLGLAVHRVQTENQQTREKRLLARELQLEREANVYQRQFIGMVAHEFRTPLAIISSALQNLRLTQINEAQREIRYDKIQRATDRLVQLTDNCLADSRLSSGNLYLDRQSTDLVGLTQSVIELFNTASEHNIKLTINGKPTLRVPGLVILSADAALLRIALSNLLDNALKHTGTGPISIDISTFADMVAVSITDTGPGIPTEYAERIFERYLRVESPGRRTSGTGLGLHVAREIATAHGGTLVLKPNHPQGCCFILTLPAQSNAKKRK